MLAVQPISAHSPDPLGSITSASYSDGNNLLTLAISNRSDVDFQVQNSSDYTFSRNTDLLVFKQYAVTSITLKTPQRLQRIELPLKVLNALVAPKRPATLTLSMSTITVEGS